MNEPKAFRCANCGQMLPVSHTGTSKCKYCGTEYQTGDDYASPIRIETMPFRTATFAEKVQIPFMVMRTDPEKAFEISLHEMAKKMAERITPCMEITISDDILTFGTIVSARLRVAVPDIPPQKVLDNAIRVDAETVRGLKV